MAATSTFVSADGDGYDLQMGRWSRRLAEPFLDFTGTADGDSVLDVGCGTGSLTFALARRCNVKALYGIDYSRPYIEHAVRLNSDSRISFKAGDACTMEFPDRSFDRVLCMLVLQFIPEAQRAVAEMRRVAKAGAIVGAAVWDTRGGMVMNRIFWDTAAMLDAKAIERRAHFYTRPLSRPGELGNAWRAAGFDDVTETALYTRMEFTSFDDFWAPNEGKDGPMAAYVHTLDEVGRMKLRDAVRLAYLDGEADGPRSYAAIAWAVKGAVPG